MGVTLIPRGQARGLTWFTPTDDPTLISKSQIFARVVGALGGRAAEEVILGRAEVTTGASGDLQQVTNMAKQMVINYGMSDIGPWSLMDQQAQQGDMIMRMRRATPCLRTCRLPLTRLSRRSQLRRMRLLLPTSVTTGRPLTRALRRWWRRRRSTVTSSAQC